MYFNSISERKYFYIKTKVTKACKNNGKNGKMKSNENETELL